MGVERGRRLALIGLVLVAPGVLASKCVDYDPRLFMDPDAEAPKDEDADGSLVSADGGEVSSPAGSSDAPAFTPALACASPNEARVLIEGRAFQIRCGCAEADGRTCTVPRGTTVIWTFADSEEHNIASAGFGSGDRLSGTYSRTFAAPGSFAYGCSIHPRTMAGYSIVVK